MAEEQTQFNDVILELDHGKLHPKLTAHLERLVEAVMETGAAGDLTLKIHVTVANPDYEETGEPVMLVAKPAITLKMPKVTTEPTAFSMEDGVLVKASADSPKRSGMPILKAMKGGKR